MAPPESTAHHVPVDHAALVRRGALTLAAGGLVMVGTYWLRSASTSPVKTYLPLVVLLAGAYVAITGVEKAITGWRAGRRGATDAQRAGVRRAMTVVMIIVVVLAAGGTAAWIDRAPYWKAVRAMSNGDGAMEKLKAIAERHAASMQQGLPDAEALASWKETASQALVLRPALEDALEGSRYLAVEGSGDVRARAIADSGFYPLTLEWMDLYQRVQTEIASTSMMAPSDEWFRVQNDIIQRIQSLPKQGPPE
ncbi:MAG: hypothetical protein ACREAA_09385 [Candidatus Polarisedimenticolia bacterium]